MSTTSGLDESDGGIGKTTIEMQDMGFYVVAGWDFEGEAVNGADDIWKMLPGDPGYPRLAWEQVARGGGCRADGREEVGRISSNGKA